MRLFKPNVGKLLANGDVDGLAKTLADPEYKIREAARDALIQIGEPALPVLCAAAHDERENVRVQATWAIGDIGEKVSGGARMQAGEALLIALRDGSNAVRQNAAAGLAQLRDPRAVQALTEALRDEAASVRRTVAWGLGQLLVETNAGGLAAHLDDSDPDVRSMALQAFCGLLTLMNDGEQAVRQAAEKAANGLGQSTIVPLTEALADEREQVAMCAASILSGKGEAALPSLTATLQRGKPRARCLAAQAIGEIGTKAKGGSTLHTDTVNILVGSLGDSEGQVRQQAAHSLGALKDSRAIPALRALDDDPDAVVREAVLEAKKALGWRPPTPPLATLTKEFTDVAEREGMRYVTSKHSRGELTDQAELQRASIGSAMAAMKERYGLNDAQLREIMDTVARGPQTSSDDQRILDTLAQLCAAYAANDTAAIARLEPQATHIGELLDARGGLPEMRRIFELLGDRRSIRTLEMHWNGIGNWRA